MANDKIFDKIKLKSTGEYFDFKPEGYDELIEKVKELWALYGGGDDSGQTPEPGGGDSGETPEEPEVTPKKIVMSSNRKNTKVTVNYTRNDGTTVTESKTLAKINTNYIICSDSEINENEPIYYTAKIVDGSNNVVEEIPGEVAVASTTSTTIPLSFTQVVPATYYLRINGEEGSSPTFHINHTGGTFNFNVETNVEYSLNVYEKNKNYSYFTVDGLQNDTPSKPMTIRNCSGNRTFVFNFDEWDFVPSSIDDFGPREEETYSMSAYSYGATTSFMYRRIEVTVQVTDNKYKDDVDTVIAKVIQDSEYAEEDNQEVEMDMSDEIRDGYLCPSGGSFTFKIKPKCYWYIYNEFESGFGVPNYMTFSPAQGGPSNDWINITASWTSDKAHPSSIRDILMKICSILGDKVVCEKKWDGATYYTKKFRLLGARYTTDPSGESSENGKSPSRAFIENLGFGVLNSFVGVATTPYGEMYPTNSLEINREGRETWLYLKSNIDYRLETAGIPSYMTITYQDSPNSTEGHPGQHRYKIVIQENTTGEDRTADIQFTSRDNRFTGSTISHITQHGTYYNNLEPDSERYSYVKEGMIWPFEDEYNSLSVNLISKKPYVLTTKKDRVYSMTYYSSATVNNLHPATGSTLTNIPLINISDLDMTYDKSKCTINILMNVSTNGGSSYVCGNNFKIFKLEVPQKVKKVIG